MFWLFFGHSTFSKLSIIWFISPVPTCLVHNCEAVWRFRLSDLAFTFVSWSNLLISINGQGAIVTYLRCPGCGKGGCYAEDDWGQGVLPYWKREKISWYGCRRGKEQSSTWSREPESAAKEKESGTPTERKSTARERGSQQEVRRTFKMLREVWLNIGVEKIDMHEGIVIKVLLDSGATGMFM